jgi:hypothetical protein
MAKRKSDPGREAGEVGYGRPPRASQFKPGQSGNPKGRPKGSLNLVTVLARALRERVVINEGGRRREISKLEAAVKQLTNKAASGDARAIQMLLGLTQAVEQRSDPAPSAPEVLPEADRQVMQSLLTRIQQYAGGDPDDESGTR